MADPWFDDLAHRLDARLVELSMLPAEWAGEGTRPVNPCALAGVRRLLGTLAISPVVDGGLSVDFALEGYGAEIMVGPSGRIVEVTTGALE
jgi:hypothetical protein